MAREDQMGLERKRALASWVQRGVWVDALLVMVLSARAAGHVLGGDSPEPMDYLLGLVVDLALVVGLVGDRILSADGERSSWGTAIRWGSAAITLWLNVAGSLGEGWITITGHAVPPVMLVLLTEYGQQIQVRVARLAEEARSALAVAVEAVSVPDPAALVSTPELPPGVHPLRWPVSTGGRPALALVSTSAPVAVSTPPADPWSRVEALTGELRPLQMLTECGTPARPSKPPRGGYARRPAANSAGRDKATDKPDLRLVQNRTDISAPDMQKLLSGRMTHSAAARKYGVAAKTIQRAVQRHQRAERAQRTGSTGGLTQ